MLTELDAKVVEITQGKCPYRARACDGLCNNCMKKAELTRPANYKPEIKTVTSNRKTMSWDELDALEDRCLGDYAD